MPEQVPEREKGRSVKMDSSELRWVFHKEYDSDEEGGNFPKQTAFDSEDDENDGHRLVRTGHKVDSFDVEALEVPGVRRNDYEV